jgi:hypothetical protein
MNIDTSGAYKKPLSTVLKENGVPDKDVPKIVQFYFEMLGKVGNVQNDQDKAYEIFIGGSKEYKNLWLYQNRVFCEIKRTFNLV